MIGTANVCDCVGVIGASGTGKGVFIAERLAPFLGQRPVTVWSPLEATDRYARKFGGVIVRSIPKLIDQVKARARAAVFVPDDTGRVVEFKGKRRRLFNVQFDLFCMVAWNTPRGVVLVEELSRVTSPSYAPEPWANLSTAGRHRGLTVYGAAQFPAQIDKSFLGSCTEIRAYRVNEEAHARTMAGKMRAPWELFLELPDLHYLHRWVRELRWERGVQAIPGVSPGRVTERGQGAYVPGGTAAPGEASSPPLDTARGVELNPPRVKRKNISRRRRRKAP